MQEGHAFEKRKGILEEEEEEEEGEKDVEDRGCQEGEVEGWRGGAGEDEDAPSQSSVEVVWCG